jgi:putative phosphoesterase
MRVAIISDLHANLEALGSFPETYDELWVLGDLVNYGPNPREVIQFVGDRATVVVRGNHDNAVGCGEDPRCSSRYREMAQATGEFTAAVLSESEKQYLASLPLMAWRVVDGKRFVLCHATPSNPLFEYCGPNSPKWIDYAESVSADVLLVGHTHMPFIQEGRGRTIANPGSLGQPKNGSPEACYAIWDGKRMELKTFPYPFEKTISRLVALNFGSDVLNDLATVLRTGGSLAQSQSGVTL